MFGIAKSIELTASLISMNQKFANTDWVDRLIWRLVRLNKQQAIMLRTTHTEVKQKNHQILQRLFWENLDSLRLSAGLMPQVLNVLFSSQSEELMKDTVKQNYETKVPKQMQLETQSSTGLLNMVYNYFTENNPNPT